MQCAFWNIKMTINQVASHFLILDDRTVNITVIHAYDGDEGINYVII